MRRKGGVLLLVPVMLGWLSCCVSCSQPGGRNNEGFINEFIATLYLRGENYFGACN